MSQASAEDLRKDRGLRAVTDQEAGTDVFQLSNGVYGFTYSPAYDEMPLFAKKPYHSFEVHRLADGRIHLIGYVAPEVKQKIEAKAGMVEAVMYPDSHGSAVALVSIDIADLKPAKKAITREDGNPLKTLVYAE
jgi:hypothetical protein